MKQRTTTPAADQDNPLTRKLNYATFNMRMMAALIDMVIIMSVGYPLCSWVDYTLYGTPNMSGLVALYVNPLPADELKKGLWEVVRGQHLIERTITTNLMQVVLFAIYIIPCWLRFQNTPGKMAMGIEIRDIKTNELMNTRQALTRFFGYIISGIPLALGFVWMLFNKKRQCWHDKIACTVVVKKARRPFSLTLRSEGQ